jgi:hypothetical protein
MKLRKQIEVIGIDTVLTLEIINGLRIRAEREAKRKKMIQRLTAPFLFWRGAVQ